MHCMESHKNEAGENDKKYLMTLMNILMIYIVYNPDCLLRPNIYIYQ